jgi:hypothetical protein
MIRYSPKKAWKVNAWAVGIVAAAALIPTQLASAASTPANRFAQVGAVVNCFGTLGDLEAGAEVYENFSAPNVLTVFVSGPEGTRVTDRNAPEPADGLFTDGTIHGETPLVQRSEGDEEGSTPAGTATVEGTYTTAGSPTRIHEAVRDDGFVITTTGTNTPLRASLNVIVDGITIPLTCDTAFAFDLSTVKQAIGNG